MHLLSNIINYVQDAFHEGLFLYQNVLSLKKSIKYSKFHLAKCNYINFCNHFVRQAGGYSPRKRKNSKELSNYINRGLIFFCYIKTLM